jgi:peptide/nickel transport system permease protein
MTEPPSSEPPPPSRPPSFRERWSRRPPGLGLWIGGALLGAYLITALSALVVFRGSLDMLSVNPAWMPPFHPIAPSWDHPFGVLPGFGTGLFTALWKATPWDLAIVASILALDVALGYLLGGIAGFDEGGLLDGVVTFVGDSFASIPSFFLVIIAFSGLSTVYPHQVGIPVFVVLFGLILWPTMARTVREQARAVAHEPYVEAARASGASSGRILTRHILPNSLGPVLAQVPLDVAPIFFVLSAFPWFFNCTGPVPPIHGSPLGYITPHLPSFSPLPSDYFPEWGYLLGFGTCEGFSFPGGFSYWWMYLFPLLAILVLGLAIGLVCDGIDRWRRTER